MAERPNEPRRGRGVSGPSVGWRQNRTEAPSVGERLWSVHELAEFLGVPVQTIYWWRYRGEGPPAVRIGRHLRFRPADVERWLAERADASESTGKARS